MKLDTVLFSRLALFIDYFWFGLLKVIGMSPAAGLVSALQAATLPWLPPNAFLIGFGAFEVVLGICLLMPKFTKWAYPVMWLHMAMTFLPLALLPQLSWSAPLVPTIVGQYILKNFVLVMLGVWVWKSKIK